MNLEAIIIANGFGVSLMVMLLVCAGKNIHINNLADRIFYAMIWATIMLCTVETSTFCIDGRTFAGAYQLNTILNVMLFATTTTFVYLWILYVDYKLFEDLERVKREFILAIPAAIVFVMAILNLFIPVLFRISDDNVYSRTPLIYVSFAVSFFYLFYAEFLIYRNRKKSNRYLFLPSIIFLLPILIGSILQMLFYGLSLTWASLSISMISIYINVQSESSAVDSLSGVYTRKYLDGFLQQHESKHHRLSGLMIDIDRFKDINDTYGHLLGDDAIEASGKLLHSTCGLNDTIARYGGDEFIVIRQLEPKCDMSDTIKKIENGLSKLNESGKYPFDLSFSYGMACFDPDEDTIDDFLKEMDISMYDDKRAKSKELPDRRKR